MKRSIPAGERLSRAFGDLKIRPKLMVLHNLFFLVLSCAIYFSLIPIIENRVAEAREREVSLITQVFGAEGPMANLPGREVYEFAQGTPAELGMPREVMEWLERNPGRTWHESSSDYLYRKELGAGVYKRLRLPRESYNQLISRAKWTLFVVLGLTYLLAVLLLELIIMPQYVYRPIRLMLEADVATQHGDRENELIPEGLILDDEIGQIMRSRNETIAELRKHEEDLELALRRLEAQDRLVSLGLMSASVAHELNTPIAVLQGSIEKLLETITSDSATQERLCRMNRVAQRLRKISEGLLDFARVRKQESERVVLRPLLDEAWSLVTIDEKASGVRFHNQVAAEAAVTGNADRLVQVMVNLLRNAVHAVESGGNVFARSKQVTQQGRQWVTLCVEDDGPGIPADVLPDIFDAFVSSRLDARGTGLGLTVAEGIVQQHGGTIAASNRPEGGASLSVCLPAADHQEMTSNGR
ncbi:MAG: HAMP domain-containing sensor histidine kinase [Bryobacteraceae bacterium]|nr:HAMP domain-containing sensor histidine kinase [Bryobacteraceae bacterium]